MRTTLSNIWGSCQRWAETAVGWFRKHKPEPEPVFTLTEVRRILKRVMIDQISNALEGVGTPDIDSRGIGDFIDIEDADGSVIGVAWDFGKTLDALFGELGEHIGQMLSDADAISVQDDGLWQEIVAGVEQWLKEYATTAWEEFEDGMANTAEVVIERSFNRVINEILDGRTQTA